MHFRRNLPNNLNSKGETARKNEETDKNLDYENQSEEYGHKVFLELMDSAISNLDKPKQIAASEPEVNQQSSLRLG